MRWRVLRQTVGVAATWAYTVAVAAIWQGCLPVRHHKVPASQTAAELIWTHPRPEHASCFFVAPFVNLSNLSGVSDRMSSLVARVINETQSCSALDRFSVEDRLQQWDVRVPIPNDEVARAIGRAIGAHAVLHGTLSGSWSGTVEGPNLLVLDCRLVELRNDEVLWAYSQVIAPKSAAATADLRGAAPPPRDAQSLLTQSIVDLIDEMTRSLKPRYPVAANACFGPPIGASEPQVTRRPLASARAHDSPPDSHDAPASPAAAQSPVQAAEPELAPKVAVPNPPTTPASDKDAAPNPPTTPASDKDAAPNPPTTPASDKDVAPNPPTTPASDKDVVPVTTPEVEALSEQAQALFDTLQEGAPLVLQSVKFKSREDLNPEVSDPSLPVFGELMQKRADLALQVRVHTDATSDAAADETLTLKQAEAFKSYLAELWKVDAIRLSAKGLGGAHPMMPNISARSRAMNRRIELVKATPQ